FQAEDGIRDFHVTGVQTCALPIFGQWKGRLDLFPWIGAAVAAVIGAHILPAGWHIIAGGSPAARSEHGAMVSDATAAGVVLLLKIGRASCRERVEVSVVGVPLKIR